jgi:hypothetical protein
MESGLITPSALKGAGAAKGVTSLPVIRIFPHLPVGRIEPKIKLIRHIIELLSVTLAPLPLSANRTEEGLHLFALEQ